MSQSYDDQVRDIANILNAMKKEAQENQRPIVNPEKTDKDRSLPGKSAPKDKEKDEAIAGSPEETEEDSENKSTDATVPGTSTGEKHENAAEKLKKASAQGDLLLSQIYKELYKKAQDEEKEEEEEEDIEDTEGSEEVSPEEVDQVIEQLAQEAPEEEVTEESVELTPEEEAELQGKSASYKKAYRMSKAAGINCMRDLISSGTLEKIALSIYGPQIEQMAKSASAEQVDEDAMMKTAAYIAGQMTREFLNDIDFEKSASTNQVDEDAMMKTAAYIAGQMTREFLNDIDFEKNASVNSQQIMEKAARAAAQIIQKEKDNLMKTAELLAAAKIAKLKKQGKIKFVNP